MLGITNYMKRIIIQFTALLIIFVFAAGCVTQPRWQLQDLQTTWGTNHTGHTAFLFDSATGKTWRLEWDAQRNFWWQPVAMTNSPSSRSSR
jgi:hypothetical protein